MCGTDGYSYNFQIYKGNETVRKREALGARVVEDIVSILDTSMLINITFILTTFSQAINYLTTLLKNIRAQPKPPGPIEWWMSSQHSEKKWKSISRLQKWLKCLVCQWKDNSVVSIGTNFSSITPLKKVIRWVKGARKVAVDQPNLIADYNTGMGGVDLLDMQLA